ncbi:hypothetical protein A2U01_0090270, partial [Trifolium medium]|nr:hypothetical protein [Trifolium medium]
DAHPAVSFHLARDVIHNWQADRNARQQQQISANLELSNDGNETGIGTTTATGQTQKVDTTVLGNNNTKEK